MKWYEVSVSNGDGTYGRERFRTIQEAEDWLDKAEQQEGWEGDGDGNVPQLVDTESKYFYHNPEDDEWNA